MSYYGPPAWQPRPPARSTMAWSVLWTLVPLLTCGIGTPAIIGHAARKLRSPLLAFAAVVYGVGIGVFMVGASIYGSSDRIPVWLDTIGAVGLFGSWIGGLVHAVILRESVFRNPQVDARPLHGPDHGHLRTPYPAAHPVSPAARPPAQWQSPRPHVEPPRYGGPQGSQTSYGARPHDTHLYDSGPHASNPYDGRHDPNPYDGPHGSGPYDGRHDPSPYDGPRRPRNPHGLQDAQGAQSAQGARNPRGPAASTPSAGTPRGWLGPYRLIGELGKGGQGKVYLALTPQGQKVAIKVLHEHVGSDRVVRERFLREVEATRRVATFSTARVLDVNITEDQAYVVSEYVEGVSLEQLVRDRGPRDEDGLTRLALATAGALAAIHRAGIVHRDFKPANVLIGADGPRVIDFGIARALDQVTATSGKIMGTPAYMSPEQLAGEAIGTETDVFSWAATMLFAASGRAAFGEDTIPAILNRVINHHPDLSPMPPSLRALAAACLDKLPANRPTASDIMLRIVH
ncbi:protein kinase domain-containing protein [Streptosporangium longisporum]|uniref:protein kinase domain-containing protein n=1 Tax=Streptosporangium longisporum TaxID=46187 RepID=UPI0039A76510